MKADRMKADQIWKMRASAADRAMIRRVAKRLRLTQSGTVRFLIQKADEFTREGKPEERKPITA